MKSTISKSKTNSKTKRVPVTAISQQSHKIPYFSLKRCIVNSHNPQKFPLLLLNHCSAIRGKFRAFVRGFPFGGVRGGLRCCVLYDNRFVGNGRYREGGKEDVRGIRGVRVHSLSSMKKFHS
jgi:hypothetical protein